MGISKEAEREARERYVFGLFVACSGLPVVPGSIKSRKPQEPDIICSVEGEGEITFELVELADEIIRKAPSDTTVHRECFERAITAFGADAASRFRHRYRNAVVQFRFRDDSSLGQRKKGIVAAVRWVAGLPEVADGPVREPEGGFPGIEKVTLKPCRGVGPVFDDTKAYNFLEPAKEIVLGKLHYHYCTSLPLELLAYYDTQPVLPESHWLPGLSDVVREELPSSQFRRVWVFDKNRSKILFVWPEVRPRTV